MTVKALKTNNMKKGPFKMKGYAYPGTSPVKDDKSKFIQDPSKEQGYQLTKDMGVMTFETVENLKKNKAPKDVIQKEYDKQIELFKQRKA